MSIKRSEWSQPNVKKWIASESTFMTPKSKTVFEDFIKIMYLLSQHSLPTFFLKKAKIIIKKKGP